MWADDILTNQHANSEPLANVDKVNKPGVGANHESKMAKVHVHGALGKGI